MIQTLDLNRQHAEIRDEISRSLLRVVDSGQFILGEEVQNFEIAFAKAHGCKHAIGVNSGTDALKIVMRAIGVGRNDEVITTANTFVGTVGAIMEIGAVPVLVDVGSDENMDPESLASAITERTKAVLVIHLRGIPANMSALKRVCDSVGIPIVEDCAQAAGAMSGAAYVGSLGVAGCFSFHPQKNLGAIGDGGLITTNHDDLAIACRLLRNHGLRTRDQVDVFGYNSRLDSLQAAILNAKLPYLHLWNERRREIAAHYSDEWRNLPLELPTVLPGDFGVFYHYVVRLAARDDLRAHLFANGIDALVHYPTPIHLQPAYEKFSRVSLLTTEAQARSILSIPAHNWLTDVEVDVVTEAMKSYFKSKGWAKNS